MAIIRFKALEESFSHRPFEVQLPSAKPSDYFGINVFDRPKMQKYLSKQAYRSVVDAIDKGTKIDRIIGNQVADGMRAWALEHGATHYTHWFHPLTDGTAEKHDAFLERMDNTYIETFDGNQLIQAEPDASSFPSGGIRNTFEARGYTAWDPSSPAFIVEKTLVIPTVFISYTGEALDYKTPLLKSLGVLDRAATDVCKYFDPNVTKVNSNIGWEQEYFLIDESLYNARPDLVLTDRTLMGHASAKDQQLEDHYFSSIPMRVAWFMYDFEVEAYKLGIPVKTRHNEVAPNQFECAPIFEEANLAIDHNQLIMDVMKKVAQRHHFKVLFHEKPFKGINGSGKHNNWSMATNTGVNLFQPGKDYHSNLQFLTFLVNTVAAVYKHSELLLAGIASAGNEHRLGANEAPPAIISVFLGKDLNRLLDDIEKNDYEKMAGTDKKKEMMLEFAKIPSILLDNTDRNRTSPFAFTGNRFEFRAVGSAANCGSAMILLNTAIADQLRQFKKEVDDEVAKGVELDDALVRNIRKYIIQSKAVRFEGNGYSQEWVDEAARRGLKNITNAPAALKAYLSKQSEHLLISNKIFSEKELEARYEVLVEKYVKKIQIESRVLGDLAINHIVPTAIRYQTTLIENVRGLKELYDHEDYLATAGDMLETIKVISKHVTNIKTKVHDMIEARKVANHLESSADKADAYSLQVKPYFEDIRDDIDRLELIIDDEIWTLPKYRELLFIR